MDNASVFDVLVRAAGIMLLKKYGLQFHPQNARIRCLAHVVNLIVQYLLASLNEAEDPETETITSPISIFHSTMTQTTMKRFSKWRVKVTKWRAERKKMSL